MAQDSLWYPLTTPSPLITESVPGQGITTGTVVRFTVAATRVLSIVYYRSNASASATGSVALYNRETGALLASKAYTGATGTGWRVVNLDTPVEVDNVTAYILAHFQPATGAGNIYYPASLGYFTSADFTSPGGTIVASISDGGTDPITGQNPRRNGLYTYGAALSIPSSDFGNSNYFVDVVYDNQIATSYTMPATTLDIDANHRDATLSRGFAHLLANVKEFVLGQPVVNLTYGASSSSTSIWSPAAVGGSSITEANAGLSLGTAVRFANAGRISGVSFYRSDANISATGTVAVYQAGNSTALATKAYDSQGGTGWRTVSFDTVVPVLPGVAYKVVWHQPAFGGNVYYQSDPGYFAGSDITSSNGRVVAFANDGTIDPITGYTKRNALYTYGAALTDPILFAGNSETNYVDVVFISNPPTLTADVKNFALTGIDASLRPTRRMAANTQARPVTFNNVNLITGATRRLIGDMYGVSVTGVTTQILRRGYRMPAAVKSLDLTSFDIAFSQSLEFSLSPDTYGILLSGEVQFLYTARPRTSASKELEYNVAEYIEEAFERNGLELRTSYDLRTAKRSLNFLLQDWANRGLNHWTVQQVETTLVPGQIEYLLGIDTIDLVNLTINQGGVNLTVDRVSRDDFRQLPNLSQTGRPNQFFIDRQIHPRLKLWPVPDQAYTITYDRLVRMDVVNYGSETVQIPFRFYPCLAAGLAYYLALKKRPDLVPQLKALYEEEFLRASEEDRDRASLFILPSLGYRS